PHLHHYISPQPPPPPPFPYTTLFRSFAPLQTPAPERLQRRAVSRAFADFQRDDFGVENVGHDLTPDLRLRPAAGRANLFRLDTQDRKSTRLNSSHVSISYAVFCLKTK